MKQEIDQIKKRVSSLEKAFDSVLTKDDSEAIEEARQDLAHGKDRDLFQKSKEEALLKYEVRPLKRASRELASSRAVQPGQGLWRGSRSWLMIRSLAAR